MQKNVKKIKKVLLKKIKGDTIDLIKIKKTYKLIKSMKVSEKN